MITGHKCFYVVQYYIIKDKLAGGGMKEKKYGIGVLCILAAMVLLGGCSTGRKKPAATEAPNDSVTYEKGADFTGVVKSVDSTGTRIVFYNTVLDAEEEYSYSGGTEVYSKNDRDMSMGEVVPGEVYDVYLGQNGGKVTKMKEAGNILVQESRKILVDSDEKRITVDDVNYAYNENLVALSDGRAIDPREITTSDEVTFRGIKGHAYSLVVTKGHGYIQPSNYKDFIGGVLTLHGEAILPVSKDMLLVVPEGTQQLTMDNGDLTGTATLEVRRNQVTKVNMAQYQNQVPDTARVTFEIEPQGAELYVNGNLTDYSKKVPLKYGNHSVKVVLEGYNEYSGIVTVKDSGPTVRINLAKETADVDTDTSSVKKSDSSSDDKTAAVLETDKDHTITVSAPEGAAVYVNGTYKGTAPCNFTKLIGSVTLTLTKKGCETKSYNIEISDDGLDVNWSFPDLLEGSSNNSSGSNSVG